MKLMSSNSPNLPKQKIFTTWAMHPCNLLNHVSVTEHLWCSVNHMGNWIWKKISQNRIHCNGMLMVVFSNSTWLKVGSELQSKTERTWIDRHWKSIEYINIQLLAVTGRLRWYVFSLAQWSDSTTFFVRLSKGLTFLPCPGCLKVCWCHLQTGDTNISWLAFIVGWSVY